MRLIVSGKTKDFTPELETKLGAKLARMSKLIEQRGEREAHVTHQLERHLHKVEVVVNFHDHSLVGEGIDPDLEQALCHATEKLEKQIVKLKTRWRDTHRDAKGVRADKESWDAAENTNGTAALPNEQGVNGKKPRPKIFRVNYDEGRKPMTLEEALLEITREPDDYVVYREASRNCLSVLIRRPDGHFDLIES